MTTEEILTAIGLIGLGGLLKSVADFLIVSRKSKLEKKHTLKETRYKAVILLCYCLVYYDKEKASIAVNRPDITSIQRLKNEVHAEFINMSLFASDKVIAKMKVFIQLPNNSNLGGLAIAMRKDLYGVKTTLKDDHFVITVNNN